MKLPPDPDMDGYDDESVVLDEAMRVLGILNTNGKHTLETLDAHAALWFRYGAIKKNRREAHERRRH